MRTVQSTFRQVSDVSASADEVWQRVTTPEGINHEMGPYLTMTLPRAFRGKSIADVSPGTHIGKSVLLLFGLIPFGYDDITIAQIEPSRMFVEKSAMTGMRTWRHHRTLQRRDGKTVVIDQITFEPKLPIPGLRRVLALILAAFFRHRHRRLKRYFSPCAPEFVG